MPPAALKLRYNLLITLRALQHRSFSVLRLKNAPLTPHLHRYLSLDTRQLIDDVLENSRFKPPRKAAFPIPAAPAMLFRDPVIDLPGLKPHVSFPNIMFEKGRKPTDLEELGKLHLHYVCTKYLLNTRPWLKTGLAANLARSLTAHLSELYLEQVRDGSFLAYMGQFTLSDANKAETFVLETLVESSKSMAFVETFAAHFNGITTHFPGKMETIDHHLVWNPHSTKFPFEFPPLKNPTENFHYAYLCDVTKSFPYADDISPVGDRLKDLGNFGKLSFELHSAYNLLKIKSQSDQTFSETVHRIISKFETIVRLSNLRRVLKKDDLFYCSSTTMFYRYLGLLDLSNSPDEVSSWFKVLVRWQGKDARDVHLEGINSGRPQTKPPKHLPPHFPKSNLPANVTETLYQIGDLGEEITFDEVEELGMDFLRTVFLKYFIREIPLLYESYDGHFELIRSSVEEHFNNCKLDNDIMPRSPEILKEDYRYLHFIGLYSLEDCNACETFLLKFIQGQKRTDFDHSKNYLKLMLYKEGNPYFGLNDAFIPREAGLLNLPNLKDYSETTRLLLLNNSYVLRTKDSNLNPLKDILYQWSKLGHHASRFYIRHALLSKMTPASAPYYRLMVGFLTSDLLARFMLDQARTFDGLITRKHYERELVKLRLGPALVSNEMKQYFLAMVFNLTDDELKAWADHFVLVFLTILDHGSATETSGIVSHFYGALKAYDFSLLTKYRNSWLEQIESGKVSVKLPSLRTETEPKMDPLVENLGLSYIKHTAYQDSLSRGLHGFINGSEEVVRLIQAVFEADSVKIQSQGRTAEQYIGALFLQEGEEATKRSLDQLANDLQFEAGRGFDESRIPTMKFELLAPRKASLKFWKLDDISLPKLVTNTNLHKLLHVNYEISRSFLKSVRSLTRNVNELPDYCTKFGTIGENMYRVYIMEIMTKLGVSNHLDGLVVNEVIRIFMDRQFETVVAEKSNLLFSPIGLSEYSRMATQYVDNSHWLLKFGSKSFRQYVGLLSYHESPLLREWCQRVLEKVVFELQGKGVHEQMQFLQFLNDAVSEEMAAILTKSQNGRRGRVDGTS